MDVYPVQAMAEQKQAEDFNRRKFGDAIWSVCECCDTSFIFSSAEELREAEFAHRNSCQKPPAKPIAGVKKNLPESSRRINAQGTR